MIYFKTLSGPELKPDLDTVPDAHILGIHTSGLVRGSRLFPDSKGLLGNIGGSTQQG